MTRAIFPLWAGLACASAQTLQVWSEFHRVDPFGRPVAADKSERVREILSPAIARNAYTSFRVAVTLPKPGPAFLYIQQNPEVFRVTVYREVFTKTAAGWIPGRLRQVRMPHTILLPDPDHPIPDQNTVTFWVDVFTPFDAPVERVRFEAVLKAGDRWLVYPMEIRVRPPVVPALSRVTGRLRAGEPSDAPALQGWREYLCKIAAPAGGATPAVGLMLRRNAQQDIALAREIEATKGRSRIVQEVIRLTGSGGERAFCRGTLNPGPEGPEWVLRMRDALLKLAQTSPE